MTPLRGPPRPSTHHLGSNIGQVTAKPLGMENLLKLVKTALVLLEAYVLSKIHTLPNFPLFSTQIMSWATASWRKHGYKVLPYKFA